MVEYDIINSTSNEIEEMSNINKAINCTLKLEKVDNAIFNIIIVDNEFIRKLNKDYRNIDDYTDVISFALEDYKDNFKSEIRILGDIYISIDKAKDQAITYKHSLTRELSFLSVHGLLHLLGYNHTTEEEEQIMESKTEVILNEIQIYR